MYVLKACAVLVAANCFMDAVGVAALRSLTVSEAHAASAEQANFFFYQGDRRITLDPARNECVVLLDSVTKPILPGVEFRESLSSEGRTFHVVSAVSSPAVVSIDCRQLMDVAEEVTFAAPVFYDVDTRIRMIPTDEVLARRSPAVSGSSSRGSSADRI